MRPASNGLTEQGSPDERCLQFNLKQMTPPLIAGHLKHILEVEAISAEPGALNLLSRSAAGSMRDALSLLDQAIAHGAGKVEEAQVRDMLGTVDLDHLFSILDFLLAGDVAGMLRVAEDMAGRSLSFSAALQELASLMTRLQIAQFAPAAIADDLPERGRILEFATRFDPEYVQLAYQIAVQGRNELHLAPDEQDGFVMTLLRLHTFRPAAEGDFPQPQVLAVRARPASVQEAPRASTEVGASVSLEPAPQPAVVSASLSSEATEESFREKEVEISPTVSAERANDQDWHAILASLKLGGMARELGQHCELLKVDTSRVFLRLSPTHRHLQIKPAQDKLQQALSEYLGRPIQLSVDLEEIVGDTPAAVAQRVRRERQDQAVASVERDEFVREVIDIFDATLIESSIKPV